MQKEGSVSIKGPRGGVFVMYNCARLHTLFDGYQRGVDNGELAIRLPGYLNSVKTVCLFVLFVGVYPEIPEGSQLDFSALKEEVPPPRGGFLENAGWRRAVYVQLCSD